MKAKKITAKEEIKRKVEYKESSSAGDNIQMSPFYTTLEEFDSGITLTTAPAIQSTTEKHLYLERELEFLYFLWEDCQVRNKVVE